MVTEEKDGAEVIVLNLGDGMTVEHVVIPPKEKVREEDGRYVVEDTTDGGYVDRTTHHFYQDWKSIWDLDLNLLELQGCRRDLTHVLRERDKQDEDYHRAIRTQGRHLRLLKEYLGLEYDQRDDRETNVVYLPKDFRQRLDPLKKASAKIHAKTAVIQGTKYKQHDIFVALITPDKEALVHEYNKGLEQFRAFQKEMFQKIFEQDKE